MQAACRTSAACSGDGSSSAAEPPKPPSGCSLSRELAAVMCCHWFCASARRVFFAVLLGFVLSRLLVFNLQDWGKKVFCLTMKE